MIVGLTIAAVVAASPHEPKCTSEGPHEPAVLQYICQGARGWAESVASGDTTTVQRILADDFVGVDPKGQMYRKAEMVANTAKGPEFFSSNAINDVLVRFYGNVAVAQGSETWVRKKGEPVHGKFVWTDTWLNRDGKWQIIAAQDVVVPAPDQTSSTNRP